MRPFPTSSLFNRLMSCSIPPLSSTSPYRCTVGPESSPATYSGQGVVAGCPIAPSLSKLALHHTCEKVAISNLAANMHTWIDDISVDMVSTCPAKVAAKSVQVLRMMSASLDADSLVLSSAKSAFVVSDKAAQKRLQSLLRPEKPPILHLVKDLGVDSAAARTRRVASSNVRLAKALGRSGKLTRLKVLDKKKRARVASTGALTAAIFGHQGQGLAPKRMKVLRAMVGGHYGKLAFGSLDLVLDLQEVGAGDPLVKLVLEHWAMFQECVARNLPEAALVRRTWAVSWSRLAKAP